MAGSPAIRWLRLGRGLGADLDARESHEVREPRRQSDGHLLRRGSRGPHPLRRAAPRDARARPGPQLPASAVPSTIVGPRAARGSFPPRPGGPRPPGGMGLDGGGVFVMGGPPLEPMEISVMQLLLTRRVRVEIRG